MHVPPRRIQIAEEAAFEMDAAFNWYDRRRSGLGDQFLEACNIAFSEIALRPQAFPKVHGDMRRALLRKFPFGVFYTHAPDSVTILADVHSRRSPDVWP